MKTELSTRKYTNSMKKNIISVFPYSYIQLRPYCLMVMKRHNDLCKPSTKSFRWFG